MGMKLEPQYKGSGFFTEYVCELTKELDKLSGIDNHEDYAWVFHHYILRDSWYIKNKCVAIRVPGGTVGCVWYDDDFRITKIEVDTNYVIKTYPDDINEIIQNKYVGTKIEFS